PRHRKRTPHQRVPLQLENLKEITTLLQSCRSRFKQKLIEGIVCFISLQSQIPILDGVTVRTTVRTCVVCANIPRCRTSALRPISLLARNDGALSKTRKSLGVNAPGFKRPLNKRSKLRTNRKSHI